jgi:phosphomannomutase / phosphoglucomutase
MNIKKTVFREYDIRGVAGNKFDKDLVTEYEKWYGKFPGVTLDLDAAEAIGKAYGSIVSKEGGKKVLVGYEKRPFGDKLKNAFIKGVLSTGISVIDGGILLTPMVYFLTAHLKLDGGVSVTGSHNIYFYNGFKMMKKNVRPIYGEELQKMHKMIKEESYVKSDKLGKKEKKNNLVQTYFDYMYSKIKLQKPFKVTVDCGNGSAGLFAEEYLTKLGCQVIGLYTNVDTSFPNHVPDPEPPQNLVDLQKAVVENKSDLGIAFDADGDRSGFVDEKGQIIQPDDVLILLARDVLKRYPGKTILYDVKSTQLLETLIPKYGGVPFMHKTGHAPIKETVITSKNIILGGEVSGHQYFVEDNYGIDDGLWSAAKVLELLSKQNQTFSEFVGQLPRPIRTPEIKIPVEDEVKFELIKKITKRFLEKYRVITIDGSRIQFSKNSWGLVRASNTSPYLTLRFEAETEAEIIRMKNLVQDELDKFSEIKDKLDRTSVASLTGTLGWL